MANTVGRQFYISQFQREVIIGCLLGDGRLECRSKEGSARLRIHYSFNGIQDCPRRDFVLKDEVVE